MELNKEQKIKILNQMLWLNFRHNIWSLNQGLCSIYRTVAKKLNPLEEWYSLVCDIPELFPENPLNRFFFWWPYEGSILPWYYRHKAILKAIKEIKQNVE